MSFSASVEALLQPVGLVWFGCLVATVVSLVRKRRRLACFTGSIVLLLQVVGGTNLTAWLLASLERPYDPLTHPLPAPGADAVVMLGGSHSYSRRALVHWDAGEPSDRIFASVELVRRGVGKVLVLGGSHYEVNGERRPDSDWLVQWFQDWKVPVNEVIQLGICRDTRDEANKTADLVIQRQWKRVIVVTSGYHLRRAEGVFRKAGVPVEMVGAEFLGLEQWDTGFHVRLVPEAEGLKAFRYWIHEMLGLAYYRAFDWI